MIQVQIIGIRKLEGPYDHSAITHYQWRDEMGQVAIWERMQMVNWILKNLTEHKAYVKDSLGEIAYCKIVKNQFDTLFLETYADQTRRDNLLSLPLI